jgi:hypothetical protein
MFFFSFFFPTLIRIGLNYLELFIIETFEKSKIIFFYYFITFFGDFYFKIHKNVLVKQNKKKTEKNY